MFIADKCDNQEMRVEALRMAYNEIKKGEDTNMYRKVIEKIDGKLGDDYCLDQMWIDTVDRRADVRKADLEMELHAAKTKPINCKRIRECYNDIAYFYYSRGELKDALDMYLLTEEYCATAENIIQMCLSIILVSIEMGEFERAITYVKRAESLENMVPETVSKLCCAAGLCQLEYSEYNVAAQKFLKASPELGSNYTELISPQDVAIYGGLCALASFDRAELKSNVIDNFNFRNFLELAPEISEIINDFYSSCYSSSLDNLQSVKVNLSLDVHIHDHLEKLCRNIRGQAFIQYTHQFAHIDLRAMAKIFKTDVSGLEEELVPLMINYQKKLKTEETAASLKVTECESVVTRYEKAIEASERLKESSILQFDLDLKQLEKDDITRGKKAKRNKVAQWQRSQLSDQVCRLNAEVSQLDIYSQYAMEDKDIAQLQSLLASAELEHTKAKRVRATIKKTLAASLSRTYGFCNVAEVPESGAYPIKGGQKALC